MSRLKTGIDFFLENPRPGRLGVVTNHTGRLASGKLTIDGLIEAGFDVAALFFPEHGLYGVEKEGERTGDSRYRGIRAYSLYGENRRPSSEQLSGLEAVLFDMQDLGLRYYTYLYTLAYVMDECARHGLPLIVTDRPVPLGRAVEGNPLGSGQNSFVGGYGLPNRTGLTLGEFALYLKKYYLPRADLTVVPLEGYAPGFWPMGEAWINPSPNIPSPEAALIYGGTCLVEGTSLSEGRGTTRPFEVVGAPGLDGDLLSDDLNRLSLGGVRFYPARFKPAYSKHAGRVCGGVQIHVTDREVFHSLNTGLALLSRFFYHYSHQIDTLGTLSEGSRPFLELLSGSSDLALRLKRGEDHQRIIDSLTGGEESFRTRVEDILLYREPHYV